MVSVAPKRMHRGPQPHKRDYGKHHAHDDSQCEGIAHPLGRVFQLLLPQAETEKGGGAVTNHQPQR